MGPVNHSWYWLLDRVIVGGGAKMIGKKVLSDQLIFAPVCINLFYTGGFWLS